MSKKVSLRSFTEKEFERYLEWAIQDYANNLLKSGNSKKENAYEDADGQFKELLSEGLQTPNNYFYVIENNSSEDVGFIWYAQDKESGYIYDFLILEQFRRNGNGFQTLFEIEKFAKEKGKNQLRLQVFKYNESAMNLYYKMGYVVLDDYEGSMLMQKSI